MAMTKEHKAKFTRNRVFLCENLLFEGTFLLDYLLQEGVITEEMKEEVQSGKTRRDQVTCLLDLIPRRGDRAYHVFLEALKQSEMDHIRERLMA